MAEKTGVPKMKAEQAVDALFHSMKEALTRGERMNCAALACSWLSLASAAWAGIRGPAKKWQYLPGKDNSFQTGQRPAG